MNLPNPTKESTLRVAVPYYGTLTHPQTGMASIFFLADVDIKAQKTLALQMRVWNCGRQPELATWLKEQNVVGVLCRDRRNPYLSSLKNNGLWIHSDEVTADAEEMVARWISCGGAAA